jgi:hemoglobin
MEDGMPGTLYDQLDAWAKPQQLSADAAIELAVEKFYDRNLADDRINHFFVDTDLEKLRRHQFNFLRYAFSEGRIQYRGESIKAAHSNSIAKGLNGYHFDCVAENLVTSLTALAVPQDIIDQIMAIVGPLRSIFEPTEV